MTRKNLLLTGFFFITISVYGQDRKDVLFLGNSYTYVNNLPQLLADVALSLGDTVWFDSNTPGGYTFQGHSTNATSLSKIAQQSWDFVILQEQSQLPSFSPGQVAQDVFPFADTLVRKITENDSCTTPLFYMTWGRKNGDASNCANYPPVCTYAGMQTRLRASYLQMGTMFNAEIAPVGAAWQQTRDSLPLVELYNPDESHPSLHGSYLAACVFYASIFKRPSLGATYPNGVSASEATALQQMADRVVLDSLSNWNMDTSAVNADFSSTITGTGLEVQFTNNSTHATSFSWDFGNGNTSTSASPTHNYFLPGTYYVTLVARRGCLTDTIRDTLVLVFTSIQDIALNPPSFYPNPAYEGWSWTNGSRIYAAFTLLSLDGKRLQEGKLDGFSGRLSSDGLAPGIYLLKIEGIAQPVRLQKLIR